MNFPFSKLHENIKQEQWNVVALSKKVFLKVSQIQRKGPVLELLKRNFSAGVCLRIFQHL